MRGDLIYAYYFRYRDIMRQKQKSSVSRFILPTHDYGPHAHFRVI